ncbi:deoxyribose-phosphate aldolase [Acidaminobacter sp. JC074]|uniref:deoxyribose-phosphate aldolase n=1 Tax=Acidaminobacter sp. JC074 TaxID=2530199 RepID=UPI001F0DAC4D|nr:deoxyribose-phosphate aldolase [Acidaminobacter sp. JC074]MCH4888564.1 deoxyribose-phosphate aldolase [Acidaminobacter sp. JC074]
MNINKKIDHTILKANATEKELKQYCKEAIEYGFASVVVNSYNIPIITGELEGTDVSPVAVVGFPLGATLTQVKAFEAKEAVRMGAKEIDMVINIGKLKEGDYKAVHDDIKAVVQASKPAIVKVIIETSELTDTEKIVASELTVKAGGHYVKTSTGFSRSGACSHDVRLMTIAVAGKAKIKASGGIRRLGDAMVLIKAGADRLGVGDGKLLSNDIY